MGVKIGLITSRRVLRVTCAGHYSHFKSPDEYSHFVHEFISKHLK